MAHEVPPNNIVSPIDPQSPQSLKSSASAALRAGRWQEARGLLQRFCTVQPGDADAWYWLGLAHANLGMFGEAANALARAVVCNSRHAPAHHTLGSVLMRLGHTDQAIGNLQQAVNLKPSFAEAHGDLGNALRLAGRLDEAEQSLRSALRLKPNEARIHLHLALLYKQQRRYADAAASCRTAITLQPAFAEAHNELGNVLQNLGEQEQALVEIVRVTRRRIALGLLNRHSLLYWQKGRNGGRGAYRGARWHTVYEARALLVRANLQNVVITSAIYLTGGGVVARCIESVAPQSLILGGFLLAVGNIP